MEELKKYRNRFLQKKN